MPENNNNNFSLVNLTIEIPDFIDEALKPASVEIGRALGDIFYCAFAPFTQKASKLRTKHLLDIEQYKEEIKTELSKIPEENLLMPELSLVGPALDASKFYIDKEILRTMFAKLISSSMDSSTYNLSRACFVEIIKQLSPLDAENLIIFKNENSLPICDFTFSVLFNKTNLSVETTTEKDIFLSNPNCTDFHLQRSSLSNLIRLGLVEISKTEMLPVGDITYRDFEKLAVYTELKDLVDKASSQLPETMTPSVTVKKHQIHLTSLGIDFVATCL